MLYGNSAPTVIHIPSYAQYAAQRDVLVLETVLAHRMYKFISRFKTNDVVGVKSCETEPRLAAYYARALVRMLMQKGQAAFLCGTSNRHMDCKSNAVVCTQNETRTQGGAEEAIPYIALDGLYGEHEISRKTTRVLERNVYLAGELPNLDGVISVSCLAPSRRAEAGGSIVNLGQGLASKKGKIYQRTTRCPQVNVKKCYKCRRCVRQCPVQAITISEGHAVIDPRKCIKCGKCVEVAHHGGITYDWDATPEHTHEAVVRHAKGVLAVLPDTVVCINVVMCDTHDSRVFAGAMVSQDPVAVDCATVDLCESHQLVSDGQSQSIRSLIQVAESEGLGTAAYEMETVAY